MTDTRRERKQMSKSIMMIAGLPVGIALGLGFSAVLEKAIDDNTVTRIVCESFVGPQGPEGRAGSDGLDGKDARVTFEHVPELDGLFSEQNVKIEYHGD